MSIASLPYAESAVTSKKRHRGMRRNQGFSDCHGLHGRCAKTGAVGTLSSGAERGRSQGNKSCIVARTTVSFFAANLMEH
jgi:hypothetical protein